MVDATKPNFGNWKMRGLAEHIRAILAYKDVDFNDVTYEQTDGPEFSSEAWTSIKFTLGLDFPDLPYLIDGDVKISEQSAITKFVAKKYAPELLPQTDKEFAELEQVLNIVGEVKGKATGPCYG